MAPLKINSESILFLSCILLFLLSFGLFLFFAQQIMVAPPSLMRDLISIQSRVERLWSTPLNHWQVAHEKPLYFLLLILTRWAGLNVRVVNIFLSVLVAGGLMLMVSEISGWLAAFNGGSLFFSSPFVLSETLVFTTHTHLGLFFAVLAMWLFSRDSKSILRSSIWFGIFCAAGVVSSLHSLLVIAPLVLFQTIRLVVRRCYLAVLLLFLSAGAVYLALEGVYWVTGSGSWLSRVIPFIGENMYSFSLLPPAYSMPFFMASEVENGWFSVLILLFFTGSVAGVIWGKVRNRVTAGWLLLLPPAAFALFEFSGIEKIERVYYPVWVAAIAVSPIGVLGLLQRLRSHGLRFLLPILTLITLLAFCNPQNRLFVSACRAGLEVFPTAESRKGVYSADCGWIPLSLPKTSGVSLPDEARFVVVRKYIPPWEWFVIGDDLGELPEEVDWLRIYDRLRDHPAVIPLNSLESLPHFFYVNSDLYAAYHAKMVAPVPALVVPVELFIPVRDEVGRRRRPAGAIPQGSYDDRR